MRSNISNRVDPEIVVNEELFSCGLLDVTEFLCYSLKQFMEKENRYLGIVKSYMTSIDNTYEKINKEIEEIEKKIYNKILYLLKPIILREFSRLRSKKLSEGDCVILMIRRVLLIVSEVPDFIYKSEVKTLDKIIGKLYDNIRNRNKKDAMYNFSNHLRSLKANGCVGKYTLDKLDLSEPKKEKTILPETSTLINEGLDGRKEIDL